MATAVDIERVCVACGMRGAKKLCSGCQRVCYCCKEHQKMHWHCHKLFCADLARAAHIGSSNIDAPHRGSGTLVESGPRDLSAKRPRVRDKGLVEVEGSKTARAKMLPGDQAKYIVRSQIEDHIRALEAMKRSIMGNSGESMSDTVITHFSKLAEWGNSGMAAMRANTADLLRLIGMDNDAITKIFAAQDACFVAYRYLVHIAGTGEGVGTEQGRANTAAAFASYRTQWEYVRSATVWAILAFVDKSAATGFISAEGQRAVHERLAGDDPAATADARKAHAARCESEIGELIAIASFGPTTREDDVRKRLLGGHTAQELLNSDALLKTYLSDVGSTETMETTGAPNEGASTPEVPPKIYTSYDAFAASLPGGMTANQKREAYLREALSNAARAIKIYEQRHSETGDKADSIKAAQLKKELQLILETDSSKLLESRLYWWSAVMLGIAEMGGLLYEFQGIDGEKVKAQFEKSVEHQKELLADSARVNAELDDQLRQAQQLNGEIANANADVGKIAGRLNELKMQANSTATELSDVAAKQNAFGECTIDDIRAGDMSCVEIVADVIANRRQQLAEIGGVGQEAYAEQLRGIPNAVRSWLADPNRDAMSPEIQNALGILAKELEFSGATMVEYLQRTSTQLRSLADALGTQTAELQASHAQLMQGIQRMDALLASSRANTEVLGTKIGEITKELDTIAPIVTEYIKNAGYVTSAQAIWESMRTGTNNNLIDGVLKPMLLPLDQTERSIVNLVKDVKNTQATQGLLSVHGSLNVGVSIVSGISGIFAAQKCAGHYAAIFKLISMAVEKPGQNIQVAGGLAFSEQWNRQKIAMRTAEFINSVYADWLEGKPVLKTDYDLIQKIQPYIAQTEDQSSWAAALKYTSGGTGFFLGSAMRGAGMVSRGAMEPLAGPMLVVNAADTISRLGSVWTTIAGTAGVESTALLSNAEIGWAATLLEYCPSVTTMASTLCTLVAAHPVIAVSAIGLAISVPIGYKIIMASRSNADNAILSSSPATRAAGAYSGGVCKKAMQSISGANLAMIVGGGIGTAAQVGLALTRVPVPDLPLGSIGSAVGLSAYLGWKSRGLLGGIRHWYSTKYGVKMPDAPGAGPDTVGEPDDVLMGDAAQAAGVTALDVLAVRAFCLHVSRSMLIEAGNEMGNNWGKLTTDTVNAFISGLAHPGLDSKPIDQVLYAIRTYPQFQRTAVGLVNPALPPL